jgi:L-amino acid N-acyltransferase YncA
MASIIRPATEDDVTAIADIYNATVVTTTTTWRDEPQSAAERAAWFDRQREQDNPVLVAEDDGAVVGFASYGDFRDSTRLPGYRFTVEHTVHVLEANWGRGLGRSLLLELLEIATAQGKHVMVGAIDGENVASLRFHERLGFVEVARMPEVGRKFDRWLDLVLVQRRL